jgi:D-amino-acid dehydrogenase
MFPPLGDVRRAVHNPAAARIDGREITAALLAAARNRGLALIDAEVTDLERRGERVVGLRTRAGTGTGGDTGEVSCGAVAIAGGAWSPGFAAQLRVRLPVQPVKGQIVHLRMPAGGAGDGGVPDTGSWPIVQPVIGHYLVAWPEGRVACGGTYESAGFDTRPTVAGVHDLLRECLVIAPGLADATVEHVRVGLRPVSADDLPVLGAVPGWANVHLSTGHGTEGLLLGPYSGALVAVGVLEGTAPPELRPFGAARFPG